MTYPPYGVKGLLKELIAQAWVFFLALAVSIILFLVIATLWLGPDFLDAID